MKSAANREARFMLILKGFDGKRLVLPDRIELSSARTAPVLILVNLGKQICACSQRKTKPCAPFRWFQFRFNLHDASQSASFTRLKHLQLLTAFSARQSVRCGARSLRSSTIAAFPRPAWRPMSIASGNAAARPSRPMMIGGFQPWAQKLAPVV